MIARNQIIRFTFNGHGEQEGIIGIVSSNLNANALQDHCPLQVVDHGTHLRGSDARAQLGVPARTTDLDQLHSGRDHLET